MLLIDEDYNFRQVLRYLLFEMGLEVDEADNGRIAVERCLSGDYALIVADANTPIMQRQHQPSVRCAWGFDELPVGGA